MGLRWCYHKGLGVAAVQDYWLRNDLAHLLTGLSPSQLRLHSIRCITFSKLVIHGLHELCVLGVHAVLGLLGCLAGAGRLLCELLVGY